MDVGGATVDGQAQQLADHAGGGLEAAVVEVMGLVLGGALHFLERQDVWLGHNLRRLVRGRVEPVPARDL